MSTHRQFLPLCLAAGLGWGLTTGSINPAHAADAIWISDATAGWAAGTNWDTGSAPGATSGATNPDTAWFYTTPLTASRVVTVDTGRNVKNILFTNSTSGFTIQLSGGSLLLSAGGRIELTGSVRANIQTFINSPITLEGSYTILNNGGNAAPTVNLLEFQSGAGIAGAPGLGSITLTLGGSNGNPGGKGLISGVISDGSGNTLQIVKQDSGDWQFDGANTFTGGLLIKQGGLLIGNNGRLGGNTAILTVTGGALNLGGTSQSMGVATLSGGVVSNGTLNATDYELQSGTVPANLAGVGVSAHKSTTGTMILSGNNTFSGGLVISNTSAGLCVNSPTALGIGSVDFSQGGNGGSFDCTSSEAISNANNNPLIISGDTTFVGSQSLNLGTGSVDMGTLEKTITVVANTLEIGGDIYNTSGNSPLTKAGPGTLILSGASTYTGPTVVAQGALLVNGSLGTNTVTVLDGGTLGGTGVLGGAVTVSGGTLSPGTSSSPGTLTIHNTLTLSGSTVNMRITQTGGTPASDLLAGMSLVNYGGILNVTDVTGDTNQFVEGDSFHLFSATNYSGTFAVKNLPVLNPGLAWLWTPSSGTLTVVTNGSNSTNPAAPGIAFYVSPSGSDITGDGSISHPWQTVERARDYIRTNGVNSDMQSNIVVYLRGGRYQLNQTLAFTPADSGNNGFYITYQSYPGEVATLSGGMPVTGWSPVPGKPYWVASVPTNAGFADYFRQLYVNGVRADRAHSDWITGVGFFDDPATTQTVDGVTFQPSDLKNYSNVTDLRLLHIRSFKVDEFPVTGITTNSSTGLIQVELQQPYCQTRYDYAGGPPNNFFSATDRWMFLNAFEELDQPGEWYLNRVTHQVYYYPYSYEDMNTAQVYAPVVQTLVSLTGNSTTDKVRNIRFKNLVFEHGNWFFPGNYFIGGAQAEILFPALPPDSPDANPYYGYEVPGQIQLNNTVGIQFIGDIFRHLASCGIQTYNGTLDTLIQGNIFYDLTGAAVIGGRWGNDAPIPNQQICTNTIVADNVIRDTGRDFMASTLIDNLNGYAFQVLHNDMADGQYMGFHERNYAITLPASVGTGGTVVSFNRISMANVGSRYGVGDAGYLYSFGVWPDSTFQGNDINGVVYAQGNSSGSPEVRGIMFDNDSYGLTAVSNVVRNTQPGLDGYFLYTSLPGYKNYSIDNYGDATVNNFNAVVNVNYTSFSGALPPGAQGIVANAGLEPAYTNLLQFIYAGTNLTQGKFTWASSQAGASNPPDAAVDGDYTTFWQPAASDTNQCWWAVDLGAKYCIQRIALLPESDADVPEARSNFQVQGANDPGFTNVTVLSEQNAVPFAYYATGLANSWIKYINNPHGFRYLRVIKTASGTLGLSEFQVCGYPMGTSPISLTTVLNGNTLTLSWPLNYLGWILQEQTNRLEVGLSTNWMDVPGTASITSTNLTLNSKTPTMFFRLRSPGETP